MEASTTLRYNCIAEPATKCDVANQFKFIDLANKQELHRNNLAPLHSTVKPWRRTPLDGFPSICIAKYLCIRSTSVRSLISRLRRSIPALIMHKQLRSLLVNPNQIRLDPWLQRQHSNALTSIFCNEKKKSVSILLLLHLYLLFWMNQIKKC